jgi:hypothetical protein
MVFYDNIDVAINGSGILAESAAIAQVNYLDPAYVLEKRGEMSQPVKDSIRSKIDIGYFVEVDHEPSLGIVDSIKKFRTDDHNAKPFTVEIANISGSFYLEDYQLRIQPNQIVKAAVSFVSYDPLSGDVSTKRVGSDAINYNQTNSFAHGWTTFVTNSGVAREFPTYSFEYQFRASWNPIYSIGNPYPKQVQLLNAGEMLVLTRDDFKHVQFSGQQATEAFASEHGNDYVVDAVRLNLLCDSNTGQCLQIGMSGGVIVNSRLQAQVGEMVRSKIGINRNY